MLLAGIWSRLVAPPPPAAPLGLPSMKMVTLGLPRRLTAPVWSTLTEGTFWSTSVAVPPTAVRSLATFTTRLSRLAVTGGRSPCTTTSVSWVAAGRSRSWPSCATGVASLRVSARRPGR